MSRRILLRASFSFVLGVVSLRAGTSALFDLSGETHTAVTGVSANGRVLIGSTVVPEALPAWIPRPLVWRQADGAWEKTVLPVSSAAQALPHAVSADGTVIAGSTGVFWDEVPTVWTFDGAAWQTTELPLPEDHGAQPEFISADGAVVVGVAVRDEGATSTQNIAWAWRRTGDVWSGGVLPDGENGFYREALSADGSTLGGARTHQNEDGSVSVFPTVWRHDGDAWRVFTLNSPSGEALNGKVTALSADGRVAVGEVKAGGAGPGWRAVAWTFAEAGNAWTAAFLNGLGSGDSQAYSISADGARVVGESRRKPVGAPSATLWTRVGESWSVSPLGAAGTGFSRGMLISADGRLALRDQGSGRSLYHLASARNLPLPVIVATLEQRPSDVGAWRFGGYYSNITGLAHDIEGNSYTMIGSAYVGGVSRPWVISGYAPFLFGETTRVGDTVSAAVPDLGDGVYAVTGLPAGLRYDDATRVVSGRFSRVGLFTTTILNTANKRKRTALTLVEPLPSTRVGSFQSLLTAGEDGIDAHPVARLTITADIRGGFTGTLDSDDGTTYPLRGVFAPDPANPAELAAFASYGSAETGVIVVRKKGFVPAAFRLRVNLRADGSVFATLETGDGGSYASSGEDGSLQTRYAGTRAEDSAPWRGRYTATLGVAAALSEDARPLPAGAGFATITVGADGRLAATGKLADGQRFAGSVLPGADESYRLYFLPYYGRSDSWLAGWMRFEPRVDGLHHVRAEAGEDLYWKRAAVAGSKLYAEGFGPAGLAVRAEPWRRPDGASSFGTSEGVALPLTLTSARFGNVEGGNRYALPQSVRFVAGVRLAPEAGRSGALTFSVNRETGVVTGGFTLVEPEGGEKRRVKFSGVLLQSAVEDPEAPILRGYFLEPALKSATPPQTLSGLVSVGRNDD